MVSVQAREISVDVFYAIPRHMCGVVAMSHDNFAPKVPCCTSNFRQH